MKMILPELKIKRQRLAYTKWLQRVRKMKLAELLRETADLLEAPMSNHPLLDRRKALFSLVQIKLILDNFDESKHLQ